MEENRHWKAGERRYGGEALGGYDLGLDRGVGSRGPAWVQLAEGTLTDAPKNTAPQASRELVKTAVKKLLHDLLPPSLRPRAAWLTFERTPFPPRVSLST